MSEASIKEIVREKYGEAARRVAAGNSGCCCGGTAAEGIPSARDPVTSELYGPEEKNVLPALAVNASLGCGNPTALAELSPGETVLDLGSGGGIDVLLSAKRVGPSGKAYGLDMTDEMLDLARRNAAHHRGIAVHGNGHVAGLELRARRLGAGHHDRLEMQWVALEREVLRGALAGGHADRPRLAPVSDHPDAECVGAGGHGVDDIAAVRAADGAFAGPVERELRARDGQTALVAHLAGDRPGAIGWRAVAGRGGHVSQERAKSGGVDTESEREPNPHHLFHDQFQYRLSRSAKPGVTPV